MGIIKWFMDTFIGSLGATADIQRLKEKISKNNYQKEKAILQEKLKKADELLEKSRQRLNKFTHKEVRL